MKRSAGKTLLPAPASRDVFVSHSVNEAAVARELGKLLQLGVGVDLDAIFCSSIHGAGIPVGSNFVEYIKQQIQKPKVVVVLISPHYLESHFCLCEMGAAWAMSHLAIPVVIPPATHEDLKPVLQNTQAVKIDKEDDLSELRDKSTAALGIKARATAVWENARRDFLEALPTLLTRIAPTNSVPRTKYEKAVTDYEEARSELRLSGEREAVLKTKIAELERCKDKAEVDAVIQQFSSVPEEFERLCQSAKECAASLCDDTVEAVFHEVAQTEIRPGGFHFDWKGIRTAAQKRELKQDDGIVEVNRDHPKVDRFVNAVEAVRRFITGAESFELADEFEQFAERFEEENDYPLEIESRDFWQDYLGLASHTSWDA